MSEQASGTSRQMEEALLNQLARKDERISMLEALLEQTRSQPELGEHRSHSRGAEIFEAPPRPRSGGAMAFPAPLPKSGGAQAFQAPPSKPATPISPVERVPIKLPEFTGPSVDAVAGVVMEKALERNSPSVMGMASPQAIFAQTFSIQEAEAGYEPTARFSVQHLQRHHAGRNPRKFMLGKVGSLALLSAAIAALGVGVWQHSQSALLSDSIADMRPLPLLTPPAPLVPVGHSVAATPPRSLTQLPQTGSGSRDTPFVEPRDAMQEPLRPEHRVASGSVASGSTAASLQTAHPYIQTNGATHASHANTHKVEVASTRLYTIPHVSALPHRETQAAHDRQNVRNAQTKPKDNITAHLPKVRGNDPQIAASDGVQDSLPADRSDRPADADAARSSFPDDRNVERAEQGVSDEFVRRPRRRRREADESYRVTEQTSEASPRRRLQGNIPRAMRTLDNMQDLLDSIERRKQRQAASGSD